MSVITGNVFLDLDGMDALSATCEVRFEPDGDCQKCFPMHDSDECVISLCEHALRGDVPPQVELKRNVY